MMRTCDGTDPNLLDSARRTAAPCACGLTFDDVTRSTVYPHLFIPTPADREALLAAAESIGVDRWTQAELDAITATAARRAREFAAYVS